MKITRRQLRRIIKEELSFDNAAWESGRHDARMAAAGKGDIDQERFDNDKSYAAGVDFEQEEQDNRLSWQQDRAPFHESTIVTKRQLRRIIREEYATIDYDFAEEVETVADAWAGGDNLALNIDHSKAVGSEAVTTEQETLRITESQLRDIIRNVVAERYNKLDRRLR